jgi:hypothetical protein
MKLSQDMKEMTISFTEVAVDPGNRDGIPNTPEQAILHHLNLSQSVNDNAGRMAIGLVPAAYSALDEAGRDEAAQLLMSKVFQMVQDSEGYVDTDTLSTAASIVTNNAVSNDRKTTLVLSVCELD